MTESTEVTRSKRAKSATPSKRALVWWIVGGVLGLVLAAGIYLVGTAAAGGKPTPTPTPTATVEPTAPAAAGTHAWNALFGGECLSGFADPWQERFEVVDCAESHDAQLVFRGDLGSDEAETYPGAEALEALATESCTRPGVIDANSASNYSDLQLQVSFPATEAQWTEEKRYFYCFVNRASGDAIGGTLQGSGPAS